MQDNAQPHVARILQAFFEGWWVSLLPWPAHLTDSCPSNMSGEWLVNSLFIMVLQQSLEALWTYKLHGKYPGPRWFHATMLRGSDCITWRLHWNLTVIDCIQYCNSNYLCIFMYLICGISFQSHVFFLYCTFYKQ